MQLTFAIITAVIVCGAFAERMKFSAMLVYMFFWHFLVYCPVAHRLVVSARSCPRCRSCDGSYSSSYEARASLEDLTTTVGCVFCVHGYLAYILACCYDARLHSWHVRVLRRVAGFKSLTYHIRRLDYMLKSEQFSIQHTCVLDWEIMPLYRHAFRKARV